METVKEEKQERRGKMTGRPPTNCPPFEEGGFMATPLDPKQVVSFEELLISQMVQQEALTRLLIEKGIFTKEEFLKMVKAVDKEGKTSSK
jgi:hypothetical protein